MQSLVLLPKPGKPPEDPSSLRPVCLIDHAGKASERCICRRLQEAVISAGDLSPLQYGFREHRSTVDAISLVRRIAAKAIEGTRWAGGSKEYCLIATLDIKNAFNTARLDVIVEALRKLRMPTSIVKVIRSYLSDRTIRYETTSGTREHAASCGV
ncbi:hypothetical protein KR074_007859 [Drosophila pseudoananassae]|nr:hypothetical protein KR074_007859 [Drosophila pseudoananassae]